MFSPITRSCRRHSAILREQGIKVFSYTGTAEELRRRGEERANAAGFFKLYQPMKEALKASGNGPLRRSPSEASKGSKKKAPIPIMADSP